MRWGVHVSVESFGASSHAESPGSIVVAIDANDATSLTAGASMIAAAPVSHTTALAMVARISSEVSRASPSDTLADKDTVTRRATIRKTSGPRRKTA
jgi:hypothetical protein